MVHGTVNLAKRRFHGLMRPMKLKAGVRMTKKSSTSAPCMTEMTAVMSCWKANTFEDGPCRREIEAFIECAEKARNNPEAFKGDDGYKWTTEQVNTRLRKFVRPQ